MKLWTCSISLLVIALSTVWSLDALSAKRNKQSCTFRTAKGLLDLKSVAKTDGKSTAFQTYVTPGTTGGSVYYWNPCVNVSQPYGCSGNGELFQSYGGRYCYILSAKANATFIPSSDGNGLILQYKDLYSSMSLYNIAFQCEKTTPDKPFTVEQQCPNNVITCFKLSHPVACLQSVQPTKSPSADHGLSVGSVLLIIVLVVVVLYIVIGVLFFKFVRKASGLDLCPNRSFWFSLPYLVKDGFMFLIRGCKPGSGTANSYEKL